MSDILPQTVVASLPREHFHIVRFSSIPNHFCVAFDFFLLQVPTVWNPMKKAMCDHIGAAFKAIRGEEDAQCSGGGGGGGGGCGG